jgi:hypothetical protein
MMPIPALPLPYPLVASHSPRIFSSGCHPRHADRSVNCPRFEIQFEP